MIPDEVIEGKHQAMVNKDIFLKVNNIISDARNHPITHKEEDSNLPLKRFLKCDCGTPMTGYVVKKKGLYYYKCRVKGYKNNKSAKQLHEKFKNLINIFKINKREENLIKSAMSTIYHSVFQEQFENQSLQKK